MKDLQTTLSAALKEKTSLEDVDLIAGVVLSVIRETFGGEMVYVPHNKKDARRNEIRAKFNGKNHKELAKQHGLTVRMVYAILKNEKPVQIELNK